MSKMLCRNCGNWEDLDTMVLGRCYKCAGKTKTEAKKFTKMYHGDTSKKQWKRFI